MAGFATCIRLIICALVFASAARAADLPVKALPAAPAVYNWTGIYAGVHAGYGGGMTDWTAEFEFDYLAKGPLGGIQLGVNQQIGNWVIGIEGDVSWADIRGGAGLRALRPGRWVADNVGDEF